MSAALNPALAKTQNLKRVELDIDKLESQDYNPNEMSDAQFNMLCDNMERVGFTDPLLVRPHPDPAKRKKGIYRVVGGHHRLEVAKLCGFKKVPCTVVDHADFDEDAEKFQVVRHNIIHGQMNPDKFMKLYESLNEKYTNEVAAELFGFVDQSEFKKLIRATEQSLPKEMQKDFKEAAKEIKTIDDLTKVLNYLFTQHGDTLPHGYMVLDFGGKDSIWLRMQPKQKTALLNVCGKVREANKAMDHFMEELLLQLTAEQIEALIAKCPEITGTFTTDVTTLDFLD